MKTKLILVLLFAILMGFNVQSQYVKPSYSKAKRVENEIRKQKKREKEEKEKEKEKEKQEKQEGQVNQEDPKASEEQTDPQVKAPQLIWSKYDFIPGDKVIFEDDLSGEENGEFPSRWDLMRGNVEIAEFGGENVIMFRDGSPTIMPYFKDATKDYLPEVFTIEFDLYCGSDNFVTYLFDRKNQKEIRK